MQQLPAQLKQVLEMIGGRSEDEKVAQLIAEFARYQLLETQQSISRCEGRYGMTFTEFSDWLQTQSEDVRYRHDMERAFMEWEGHEASRRYWLSVLKKIPSIEPVSNFSFQPHPSW